MKNLLLNVKKMGLIAVILISLIWVFIFNWSFVFKRKVVGEVVAAEKVNALMAIVTNNQQPLNPQAFSFSVAIKDRFSNEIFMASSEDRKWAAVTKGNCVVAAFFPYPPWALNKGMTDHNARLLRNFTSCEDVSKEDSFLEAIKFFFLFE